MHKVVKEISWYAEQQIAAELDKLGIQHCCGSEQSWHVKIIPPHRTTTISKLQKLT